MGLFVYEFFVRGNPGGDTAWQLELRDEATPDRTASVLNMQQATGLGVTLPALIDNINMSVKAEAMQAQATITELSATIEDQKTLMATARNTIEQLHAQKLQSDDRIAELTLSLNDMTRSRNDLLDQWRALKDELETLKTEKQAALVAANDYGDRLRVMTTERNDLATELAAVRAELDALKAAQPV